MSQNFADWEKAKETPGGAGVYHKAMEKQVKSLIPTSVGTWGVEMVPVGELQTNYQPAILYSWSH